MKQIDYLSMPIVTTRDLVSMLYTTTVFTDFIPKTGVLRGSLYNLVSLSLLKKVFLAQFPLFANFNHQNCRLHPVFIFPDMKTMWNNMPPPTSKLISDSQQDSLITFVNQVDRADRLTSPNGLFNLYIDASGILVIESCEVKNCPVPQMRRISSYIIDKKNNTVIKQNPPMKNWTHMFLILESNANLILLKQVPKHKLKDNGKGCGLWDDESCQLEVWSSDTAVLGIKQSCDESFFSVLDKENKLQRYELDLKNDGYLEISPYNPSPDKSSGSDDIIWRSNGIDY